ASSVGVVVREAAASMVARMDLPVEAFDRLRAVKLGPMLLREGHVGEHVGFGVVEDGGKLRHLRSDLVGDGAPLGAGGFGRLLSEGGGDIGRDDAATALAGVGENVPHVADAAALTCGLAHVAVVPL